MYVSVAPYEAEPSCSRGTQTTVSHAKTTELQRRSTDMDDIARQNPVYNKDVPVGEVASHFAAGCTQF